MTYAPQTLDNRLHHRVTLDLPVKFMCDGGTPSVARLVDISLGGAAIIGGGRPVIGSSVIAYIDKIDRMTGVVVRLFKKGFAIRFSMSTRKGERLADKLTLLINEKALGFTEKRRDQRSFDTGPDYANFINSDGKSGHCQIADCSVVGASLISPHRPFIGAEVTLGQSKARVVRHTSNGFAVEFTEYWDHRPSTDVAAAI